MKACVSCVLHNDKKKKEQNLKSIKVRKMCNMEQYIFFIKTITIDTADGKEEIDILEWFKQGLHRPFIPRN